MSLQNAHIVTEVREFKARIKDTMDRLKDIDG